MTEYLHSGENGEWSAIRDALAALDAPTTAAELGLDDAELIAALTSAHGSATGTRSCRAGSTRRPLSRSRPRRASLTDKRTHR